MFDSFDFALDVSNAAHALLQFGFELSIGIEDGLSNILQKMILAILIWGRLEAELRTPNGLNVGRR